MAAANAKKHKSKNRVTILQGLIEKNYFLNWVYLLQILIIAHIKTLTKAILKACVILKSQNEVEMR